MALPTKWFWDGFHKHVAAVLDRPESKAELRPFYTFQYEAVTLEETGPDRYQLLVDQGVTDTARVAF